MNRDTAQGQWKQLSGRIKQRWGELTDDDLTRAAGDRDYLVGRVHERYGIAREQVEDELQTLGYREDDQDADLRSSDRSAAGRMDAAGYADAGSNHAQEMEGGSGMEQGGNLDREDPSGRSGTDQRTGRTSDTSQKLRASGEDATIGDERDPEQNPDLRVDDEPPQPGGAGHTLEAGASQSSAGRSGPSSAEAASKTAGSRSRQGRGR